LKIFKNGSLLLIEVESSSLTIWKAD